ncbi:MAG: hypothetical protein DLM68_19300 [Hyphomicrobiales bacterium]|nr:MAG: hypothetical protein DLM68_19300 [Hyphomicrobiales bacterium]
MHCGRIIRPAHSALVSETRRNEHCNPKAPHEGLIQDFLEHPPLLALDLWRHLRLGKLRHLRIQGAPNFGWHLQFGQARVDPRGAVASHGVKLRIPTKLCNSVT